MLETAVLIRVPQAEPLVGDWRRRHDPSAAVGVPAHVTLIHPFLPAEEIGADETAALRALFEHAEPFAVDLVSPARFPGVLYLRPEPDGPLRSLIDEVQRRFPDHPPYGGAFDEVIPHLTVAETDDQKQLIAIESSLSIGLPVRVEVDEAALMAEQPGGPWRVVETFAFGGR